MRTTFELNKKKQIDVLFSLKQKISDKHCLVVGDIMVDSYIYGETNRMSPEAPVPVILVKGKNSVLGGAANVAGNLTYYGLKTVLGGITGIDQDGEKLVKLLEESHITFSGLKSESRITTSKTRIVGRGQQIVRFDNEIFEAISVSDEVRLLKKLNEDLHKCDVVIISDYNKGVCTRKICREIITYFSQSKKKVIVDPKGSDWSKYKDAFIVTPNWNEFIEIAGKVSPYDDVEIEKSARDIMEQYSFENLLITRSERGMTLISSDDYISYSTEAREVTDVSGAGDTVVATLAAFLSMNVDLREAVYWANRAAGIVVEKRGTSVVGIDDLIKEEMHRISVCDDFSKVCLSGIYGSNIMSLNQLLILCKSLKEQKKKIVFTNGCFDLLHVGHLQYLNEAKNLGDFLIVAVNTDKSVRKQNKGVGRPINSENDRAAMLASLRFVDAVVLFDEDTPYEILNKIKPDILVKGGDYSIENVVGKEFATETKVLSFKAGYSTTDLIERIRR